MTEDPMAKCLSCDRTLYVGSIHTCQGTKESILDKAEVLIKYGYSRPNETIKQIGLYLKSAILEFHNDGDKIPTYDEDGLEMRRIVESILGCRIHHKLDCTEGFCGRRRK